MFVLFVSFSFVPSLVLKYSKKRLRIRDGSQTISCICQWVKGEGRRSTFGKKQIERAFRIASFTEQEDATKNIRRPRDVK